MEERGPLSLADPINQEPDLRLKSLTQSPSILANQLSLYT